MFAIHIMTLLVLMGTDILPSKSHAGSEIIDAIYCKLALPYQLTVEAKIKSCNGKNQPLPTCKCGSSGSISKIDILDSSSGKTTLLETCSGCAGPHVQVQSDAECCNIADIFRPDLDTFCQIVRLRCKNYTVYRCGCPAASTTQSRTTPSTTQSSTTPLTTQSSTTPLTSQSSTTPLTTQSSTTTTTSTTQSSTTPLTTQSSTTTTPLTTQSSTTTTPLTTQSSTTPLATQSSTTPLTTQSSTTPLTTQSSTTTTPLTTQSSTTVTALVSATSKKSAPTTDTEPPYDITTTTTTEAPTADS